MSKSRVFIAPDKLSLYCVLVNIYKYRRAILKGFEFFLDFDKIVHLKT